MVLAGGEGEAGGVLDVAALDLLGLVEGELDGVADVADGDALGVLHAAEDVDGGLVTIAVLDEGDLGAGDDQRDGNVKLLGVLGGVGVFGGLGVGLAEVEGLEIDGDVGGGDAGVHLLGEGQLAVFGLLVLEVGGA